MTRTLLAFLCIAAIPLRPLPGQTRRARISSSIQASATVVTDHVGAASLRPVAFSAQRGGATIVQPTDAAAGEWRLVGASNAPVQMKLVLPATLVNSQTPAAALPIAFPATAGRWRRDVNEAASGLTFDPQRGTRAQFGDGPDPTLYVWLGGTVLASRATTGGQYRGTVTLTVFYD